MRGDREADRDRTNRVPSQLLELVPRPADIVQNSGRSPYKCLAQRRQHHTPRSALKQWCAEFSFEVGQSACEGWLSNAEVTSRGAHAAVFGDGHSVAKMVQLQRPPPHPTDRK